MTILGAALFVFSLASCGDAVEGKSGDDKNKKEQKGDDKGTDKGDGNQKRIDDAAKAEWQCDCDAAKETDEGKRILAEKECNELRKHNTYQFDPEGEEFFIKYLKAKKELEGKSCD